jgi:asparagine synthase (glutamine-hydrolysing)
MCGFAGFLADNQNVAFDFNEILLLQGERIQSRGPDSAGVWHDRATGVGLSHRRLAIVELSSAGAQPMHSVSNRFTLIYNGEIYNHMDLRVQLSDVVWRGHSDTETLLAGFDAWGIQSTLDRCVGMFAFAVWDSHLQTLTLVRDRLGEKPLYYGWQGLGAERAFLFGSELKALKVHPSFSAKINRNSLELLLRHNYVPAPHSIYQNIFKLEAGCLLTVSRAQTQPVITRYWCARDVAVNSLVKRNEHIAQSRADVSYSNKVVNQLDGFLQSAVKQQMMADVPLGAFLSGGVDSSTVVALMQAQTSKAVKTFTIGFNEEGYNEAVHAKAVAKHLGTEHTELYVTSQQAMDVIPKLPHMYCEPFADSSQIPTYLVSQLARQHVTVSLSGDAGDELFAGYNRYQLTSQFWSKIGKIPSPLRQLASKAITAVSPSVWTNSAKFIPFVNRHPATVGLGDKLHKSAEVLASRSTDELYFGLVSQIQNPREWVKSEPENGLGKPLTLLNSNTLNLAGLSSVERMMALDAMTYLPDDILCKVDRAGMAVSLEGRVPFLDHRVFEYAWSLPMEYKLREGQTKWVLRQVLYKYVPKELVERPKMGFGIPLHDWLRGPLREWAESLLNEKRINEEGYFYSEPIRSMWAAHLSGKRNYAHQLWSILMFQAWLEQQ